MMDSIVMRVTVTVSNNRNSREIRIQLEIVLSLVPICLVKVGHSFQYDIHIVLSAVGLARDARRMLRNEAATRLREGERSSAGLKTVNV